MVHVLPLYQMTPEALLKGTVLSWEPLCNSEIEQRIWEAMEMDIFRFEFPILGHLVMRPKPSFVEMVRFFSVSFPSRPLSACQVLSAKTRSLAPLREPPMHHYWRTRS
jgi:hypothetical protein